MSLHATMTTGATSTSCSRASTSTSAAGPGKGPELLAYRYNGQTVYVVPAETYEVSTALSPHSPPGLLKPSV